MRKFEEVADGVLVMTSRRYSTTTTAVLGTREALVVDPAWDADELADVAEVLAGAQARCAAGVATHLHYDHVLWHPSLGNVPRWATPWTVAQWRANRRDFLAPLVGDLPRNYWIWRAGFCLSLQQPGWPQTFRPRLTARRRTCPIRTVCRGMVGR